MKDFASFSCIPNQLAVYLIHHDWEAIVESLNNRQSKILRFIEEHGSINIHTLFSEIPASEATIRRDLALLEQKQCIMRRRGEAFVLKKSLESAFQQRENINRSAKQAIAHIAANLIQDNDTVILDAGPTTPRP